MNLRPLLGLLTAMGLAVGLLVAAPSAEAASGSVSIAAPGYSHALDQWSRGSITTPRISTSGQAKVSSRSYVIIKGRTVVAKTSAQGAKVAVSIGTYAVKVSVTYKVGKKKKSAAKSFTIKIVNSPRMSYNEYKAIKPGQTVAEVAALVGSAGSVEADEQGTDCNDDGVCTEAHFQLRQWQTASAYGFAVVFFTDGRVDAEDYKFYSN